jgi:hypothetical protein
MNCIREELIQKYVDKAASEAEIARIVTHLSGCPKCRGRVAAFQQRSEGIKKAINLLVPGNIDITGYQIPAGMPKTRRSTGRIRTIIGLSAAFVLILMLVTALLFLKPGPVQETIIIHTADAEIDANRTITQQPTVINIIDANGQITQIPIN